MLCVENNLGMTIIKDTIKDASALSLGINRETFYPICKMLKYTYGEMNRHVLILKEYTYELLDYFKLNKEISKDVFNKYVYKLDNIESELLPISNIDCSKLSKLFGKFINKYSFLSINKTCEYFQWRYLDCPFFNYKIFGDNISGFIICRIENINILNFENYNVMRVIEIFYEDPHKFEGLLNEFIKYCIKKHCLLIDFYFSNDFYSNLLKKFNFIKNPDFIPYLFKDHNPSSIKNLNFAYRPKFGENTSNLYIVKSNVDQDLPYVYNDLKIEITQKQQQIFNKLSGNYNNWNNNNLYINMFLLVINNVFEDLHLFDVYLNNVKINYIDNIELNCEYNIRYAQNGNQLEIFLIKNEKNLLNIKLNYNYVNNKNMLPNANKVYSDIDPNCVTINKIEQFYKSKNKILYEQNICTDLLINLYSFLFNNLNLNQVLVFLFISRIIGMEIPGKYSTIININLDFNEIKDANILNDVGLFINKVDKYNSKLELKLILKNIIGIISCSYNNKNNKNIGKNSNIITNFIDNNIIIGDNCNIIINKISNNIIIGKKSILCNHFTSFIQKKKFFVNKCFNIYDNIMLCNTSVIIVEYTSYDDSNLLVNDSDIFHYILEEELEYGFKYKKHINNFIGGRIALRYGLKKNIQYAIKTRESTLKHSNKVDNLIPPILNDNYGAPIIPLWCTCSISYKNNISLAAIKIENNSYIGVDIECMTNKSFELIARNILTSNELSKLGKLSNISRENEILLIFSFKESIYKAIHPVLKRKINFNEVEIEPLNNGTVKINWFLKTCEKFKTITNWIIFRDKYWITCVYCTIE